MRTYSFRAECAHDVDVWAKLLPAMVKQDGVIDIVQYTAYPGLPDVTVEVHTEASYETLLNTLRCVPDSHVMVETFRACSLNANSLERDKNAR